MWLKILCFSLVFSGAINAVANTAATTEKVYYRYINEHGNKVLDDSLPPEFAAKGYDKVNVQGVLIETVPPVVSDEVLADKNSEYYKQKEREREAKRLKVWDQRLMLRYSTVEDIEAAKVRALRELKIRISILQSNLRQLLASIEADQSAAADFERKGVAVSEELLQRIEVLKSEVKDVRLAIVGRNVEVKELAASYEQDKLRFAKIMDRVKFRNEYYSRKLNQNNE